MRAIRNLDDVKLILSEVTSWMDMMKTRAWDLGSRQIKNVAPGQDKGDVVTFEQLPQITQDIQRVQDQYYTIVFSLDTTVTDGEEIAPFVVGIGRAGIPTEAFLIADTAPSGGPLAINFELRTFSAIDATPTNTNILASDLEFATTDVRAVRSSTFITTVPRLQYKSEIRPIIVSANSAAIVTIQLVVKRIL